MKNLLLLTLFLLICIVIQAQTVTLPPYYGVQNKPDFICSESTVTDYQGNVYNTVKIGEHCWLRENLRSTKYNDGTNIPNVTNNTTWESLTTPAYCWYNNDFSTYGSVYGALYNWYAVNTGKLCPVGWHVPSWAEMIQLTDFLGGLNVAGGKLKETGTTHWASPNTGATNVTGFTALPGGSRFSGSFTYIGINGYWWSASENWASNPHLWIMNYSGSGVNTFASSKEVGLSVRCVRD